MSQSMKKKKSQYKKLNFSDEEIEEEVKDEIHEIYES